MKNKSVLLWVLSCIAIIYSIVIVGGYTRLSNAGLSIVEWAPVSGTIPPLTDSAWNLEFSKYQQSPEYQKINYGMEIEEFKRIFLVEYIHRLLGRVLGIVFLLPFLYFIFTKKLEGKDIKYFSIVLGLIGLQGGVGWLMVKSGLVDNPHVSQYRLALHLIMACIILILLTWKTAPGKDKNSKYGYFSLGLLLLQIISGAFVAGLKAGLVYNTFPLMDGELIPNGLFIMQPWYLNLFENVTMVQFIHRILGIANLINLLIYCYRIFHLDQNKKIAILLASIIILQFTLGILTLVLQAPLMLALFHQAIAIILMITMVLSLKTTGK
ncbi:MAG: COX15/CtaA family protein [Rickettsiales bacterium]|jgi:cytochrome c oxidase assembly protein subunit 15|nr:COX15/CtaA family protein [Rickettsiales bacterium]